MKERKINVSVIVPIYNGEKCIKKCVDSLVNQTLRNIEVILVNDASTDNTLSLIESYEKMYPTIIKVVSLDVNKKQGGARNAGLDIAQGMYIGFVDADDFVSNNMYESLYNEAIENNYDVVDSDYYVYDGRKVTNLLTSIDLVKRQENSDELFDLFNNYGRLWTKIFKREKFFSNHSGLRFPENIFYEDNYIQPFLSKKSKNIGKVLDAFYYYNFNEESTTKSIDNPRLYDRVTSALMLLDDFREYENYDRYKDVVEYRCFYLGIYQTIMSSVKNNTSVNKSGLSEVIHLNSKIDVKGNKYYKKSENKIKLVYTMFNLMPVTFIYALHILFKMKKKLK